MKAITCTHCGGAGIIEHIGEKVELCEYCGGSGEVQDTLSVRMLIDNPELREDTQNAVLHSLLRHDGYRLHEPECIEPDALEGLVDEVFYHGDIDQSTNSILNNLAELASPDILSTPVCGGQSVEQFVDKWVANAKVELEAVIASLKDWPAEEGLPF